MGHFTFIDLFSGIGGFRIAAEAYGGRCVGFSEINKDAISTYCANFNELEYANLGDMRRIGSLPKFDLMTAGVPCQSWSIAGKNLGFDDERGKLWDNTLDLLERSRPKAFIFENVKGLADPRNRNAFEYILGRIRAAGYHATHCLLNSYDYGVAQHRIRIYIIGFKEKKFSDLFLLPSPIPHEIRLGDILGCKTTECTTKAETRKAKAFSLSQSANGLNDYFLFNDIRNGHTTIHSWDLQDTTERQKGICLMILRNRRKKEYGNFDGNPLSLEQMRSIDSSVTQADIDELVSIGILKPEKYNFEISHVYGKCFSDDEKALVNKAENGNINMDEIKNDRELKARKINVKATIDLLCERGIARCTEIRYDFKNSKISTGIGGVSRIFLPSSDIYPTLVASDTNDYVTTKNITVASEEELRHKFISEVYLTGNYRQITKQEACRLQGFPENFILPESRARWMKLIGNSVAVPVIKTLIKAIVSTGVFAKPGRVRLHKTGIMHVVTNQ